MSKLGGECIELKTKSRKNGSHIPRESKGRCHPKILLGNPSEGLATLEQLVDEVFKLVEIHKPEIDIEKQKQNISFIK